MSELLNSLLQKLDAPSGRFAQLDRYYAGEQPLAFLSPDSKEALGDRLSRMSVNIPKLAVTALAERLRVIGFARDGGPDLEIWKDWINNDMDQLAQVAHRQALPVGSRYISGWAAQYADPSVT